MIKTLIVDDDFLVRMFLQRVTDWQKAGFELVGDARDGEEALQMAETYAPQLIFTDISMPVMDGIELIRELKKRESTAKIIVLSCHDDFEYVKEAMKLGADEYILKNLLTEESLLTLLSGIRQEIIQTQGSEDRLKKVISVGSMELKKAYFKNVADGIPQSAADAVQAGLRENFQTQGVLILEITNYENRVENLSAEEKSKFHESFLQMCGKLCLDAGAFECVPLGGAHYAVFADLQQLRGISEKREKLAATASSLSVFAERYLDARLRIGVSDVGAHCYQQAEDALSHGFYETGSVLFSWQLPAIGLVLPPSAVRFCETIQSMVEKHALQELVKTYDAALEEIKKMGLAPQLVAQWLADTDKAAGIFSETAPAAFSELRARGKLYENLCSRAQGTEETIGTGAVSKAEEYIRKNFASAISLTDVADYVHLNPTYLSFLFKQETGVNFIDALLKCRMEKAKELLLLTDDKIKDVGIHAGFHDYRYFCKTFKKITGVRPQDFRKKKEI